MLAFAHISTGASANEGFNIDEVNNRFAEPAVALTATGADIETGRVTHPWPRPEPGHSLRDLY
jgi:hypothetical protein